MTDISDAHDDEPEILPMPSAPPTAGRHRLNPSSQELVLVESWTGEIIELEDPLSKINTRVIVGATAAITVVLAVGLTVHAGGGPNWSQPAQGSPSTTATVRNEPVIEVVPVASPSGPPRSPSARATTPQAPGNSSPAPRASPSRVWTESTFAATFALDEGESVRSDRTRLLLQNNGDLVVVDEYGSIRWRAGTAGHGERAVFQDDGHLVVYDRRDRVVWTSGTVGHDGAVLVLTADGDVRIVDGATVLWSAGTAH